MPLLWSLMMLPEGNPASCGEAGSFYCLLAPLDQAGPSAVAFFDVAESGALVQGASFPTGGSGRAMSSDQDLQIDSSGHWLLATNNESNDVTVYRIESDGSLLRAPGSPFPTRPVPTRIAIHPTLPVFYVSNAGDNTIEVFEIGSDGALSSLQVRAVSGYPRDLEVEPQGRFLYVADMINGVQGYRISDDGSLNQLLGSPFPYTASRPHEIEISRSSQVLVLDLDNGLAAFSLDASGSLNLVPGSPLNVGGFAHTLALSGDDRFAYVGFPYDDQILGFGITPAAMPSPLAGPSAPVALSLTKLLVPRGAARLFAITREARTIQTFSVGEDGSLVPEADPILVVDDVEARVPNGEVFQLRSTASRFRRGDANADGAVDLADAIFTLNHLFRSGEAPVCPDAADADDTVGLDLTDPIFLLDHLFRSGPGLQAPGSSDCGDDPTPDALSDCRYPLNLCGP